MCQCLVNWKWNPLTFIFFQTDCTNWAGWFWFWQLTLSLLFITKKIEILDLVPSKHWYKLSSSHQLFLLNTCQLFQNCRSLSPSFVVLPLNFHLNINSLQTLGTSSDNESLHIGSGKATCLHFYCMTIINTIHGLDSVTASPLKVQLLSYSVDSHRHIDIAVEMMIFLSSSLQFLF